MSIKWPWDHAYVLNLDRHKDRWKKMKKELKKNNIKAERFIGIDGYKKFKYADKVKSTENFNEKWKYIEKMNLELQKKGHVSKDVGYSDKHKYPNLKPGQLGHLNSFLNIFQDAIRKNYQTVLVLEDDCLFIDNFKKYFFRSFNKIPNDWHLFYLGVNNWHIESTGEPIKVNQNICKLNGVEPKSKKNMYKKGSIYGTHAFIIKRRAIKEWLNYAYPFKVASDIAMGKLINIQKRIIAYYPCYQLIEPTSDLDDSSTNEI